MELGVPVGDFGHEIHRAPFIRGIIEEIGLARQLTVDEGVLNPKHCFVTIRTSDQCETTGE
jgi:hypothetical protein